MRKKQTSVILLLIAVLGGLGYYLSDRESLEAEVSGETVTGFDPDKETSKLQVPESAHEPTTSLNDKVTPREAHPEHLSTEEITTRVATSGQSRIMNLIEGAKLLDEATVIGVKGQKAIRVYDVGDRFKYPMVRVETLETEEGAGPMTAMVADHLMVRVKDPKASSEEVREWMREMGLEVRKAMHTAGHFLVSPGPDNKEQFSFLLESLQKRIGDAVEVAEPDFIVFTTANLPNDNNFNQLWGMHNTGQNFGLADADIDAPEAWDTTIGSREVRVAVVDTGVDYNHPDLAANIWSNPGEIAGDGIDNDENGFIDDVRGWDFYDNENDPMDIEGHGTHCAGTIGGVGNNGLGVAGVNWEVSIVPIRFLGPFGGSTSDAIESIHYATEIGVNLSSNSWGGGGFSELLKSAIAVAAEANQFFVVAAGNDGSNNENWPQYPASYTFDADVDNVVSVASTDRNDRLSYFSNYGVTVIDIAAPGSEIVSTTPNNSYSSYSGTSMATPHVAGALALYISLNWDSSFQDIKSQLLATVDPLPALEGKCVSGGRLNLNNFIYQGNNPYVKIDSVELTSNQQTASVFSPGEIITITPSFKNVGGVFASSVQASIHCEEHLVEVFTGTIAVGDMEKGAVVTAPISYTVKVPAGFETPGRLSFEIRITDSSDNSWTHPLVLDIFTESNLVGTVTELETGDLIPGVNVSIAGPFGQTVQTDLAGKYSVNMIDGAYALEFTKTGYDLKQVDVVCPRATPLDVQLAQPRIESSVDSVELEILEGETKEYVFNLKNKGSGVLNWFFEQRGKLFEEEAIEVSHSETEPYIWNDISSVGDLIKLGDDTSAGPFVLNSSFSLYGREFDAVYVTSNGYLSFTSDHSAHFNRTLDDSATPQNIIAFFWDDLNIVNGGKAYYYLNSVGETIFQFDEVAFYENPNHKLSVQVILRQDNSILIHYQEVGVLDSATIGIKGFENNHHYQVCYNAPYARPNTTLLLEQNSYLGEVLNGVSGSLEDQLQMVRLRFNSIGLAPGTYEDFIYVRSNDVSGNKLLKIPVKIRVLPAAFFELHEVESVEVAGAADGDNVIEAGEHFHLDVLVENSGSQDSGILVAQIETEDALIEINESESLYRVIRAGSTARNITPFTLRVAPEAPVGHQAKINLSLVAPDGSLRRLSFEVEVGYQEIISGTVRLHGTEIPIEGVVVSGADSSSHTDANGRYSLKVSTPGEVSMRALKPFYNEATQTVEMPANAPVNFELSNPKVNLSNYRIELTLAKGESYSGELQISNHGYGPLDWTIASGSVFKSGDSFELLRTEPYVWNDISEIGIPLTMGDDTITESLSLGFNFNFYGQRHDRIRAASNGFLSFGGEFLQYANQPLAEPSVPVGMVAFFWDDLELVSSGKAFIHRTQDGVCILQYEDAAFYMDPSKKLSAQVVLKDDDSITVHYKKVDINGFATIGLKGGDVPEKILQVTHDNPSVTPGSTLCFRRKFQELGRITSVLNGRTSSEASSLLFSIDTNNLKPGSYRDLIEIKSNDSWGNQSLHIPLVVNVYSNGIYDSFLERYNVPKERRGLREDCDNDGRSNLMEFAFGLSPIENDGMEVLGLSRTSSGFQLQSASNRVQNSATIDLEYRRRTDASGLVYHLKSSPNLLDWANLQVLSESRTETSTPDVENVRATVAVDPDDPACFYRIEVTAETEN